MNQEYYLRVIFLKLKLKTRKYEIEEKGFWRVVERVPCNRISVFGSLKSVNKKPPILKYRKAFAAKSFLVGRMGWNQPWLVFFCKCSFQIIVKDAALTIQTYPEPETFFQVIILPF